LEHIIGLNPQEVLYLQICSVLRTHCLHVAFALETGGAMQPYVQAKAHEIELRLYKEQVLSRIEQVKKFFTIYLETYGCLLHSLQNSGQIREEVFLQKKQTVERARLMAIAKLNELVLEVTLSESQIESYKVLQQRCIEHLDSCRHPYFSFAGFITKIEYSYIVNYGGLSIRNHYFFKQVADWNVLEQTLQQHAESACVLIAYTTRTFGHAIGLTFAPFLSLFDANKEVELFSSKKELFDACLKHLLHVHELQDLCLVFFTPRETALLN
jgi:hypothetical protein